MATLTAAAAPMVAPATGHATPAGASRGPSLLTLRPSLLWRAFWREGPVLWAVTAYLFVEYVRPQSIIPALDVLPWAQLWIAATGLALLLQRQFRVVRDPTHKWMVAFLAVIVASSMNAYWPAIAYAHFMDFFGWFVVYFLIVHSLTNGRRFILFLLVFLAASFKLSFFGARTWAARGFAFTPWGLMGPDGFFHNSGELAVQMAVFVPIAYHFIDGCRPYIGRRMARLGLVLPITGVMTILGASSRGGQLAMAVEAVKTFATSRRALRAVITLGLLGATAWALLPEQQRERFTTTGTDDTSRQRILYWERGTEIIRQHPVLGIGYFNFPEYFQTYYPSDVLMRRAELPHNIFIQVGTDAGLAGLLVYLALILRAFRSTRDVRRLALRLPDGAFWVTLSRGFDTAFIGFLIAGQFVTIGYYPFMWIHLAMAVAMRNVVRHAAAGAVG